MFRFQSLSLSKGDLVGLASDMVKKTARGSSSKLSQEEVCRLQVILAMTQCYPAAVSELPHRDV